MSEFERPVVDTDGITDAWQKWVADDELPGRTMADLKIAGLDVALTTLAEDNDVAAGLADVWDGWERGRTVPADALAGLRDGGVGAVIEALAS